MYTSIYRGFTSNLSIIFHPELRKYKNFAKPSSLTPRQSKSLREKNLCFTSLRMPGVLCVARVKIGPRLSRFRSRSHCRAGWKKFIPDAPKCYDWRDAANKFHTSVGACEPAVRKRALRKYVELRNSSARRRENEKCAAGEFTGGTFRDLGNRRRFFRTIAQTQSALELSRSDRLFFLQSCGNFVVFSPWFLAYTWERLQCFFFTSSFE